MSTQSMLEKNKLESDALLFRVLKISTIFTLLNCLSICISRKGLGLRFNDYLGFTGVLWVGIPLLYYKFSKTKKHFLTISIISIEVLTIILYLAAKLNAGILWVVTFLIAGLYFDTALVKKLTIIKLPVFVITTFITPFLYGSGDLLSVNLKEACFTSVFYVLQIAAVGVLFYTTTKKFNNIFFTSVSQNENMEKLYAENIQKSNEINTALEDLYERIEQGNCAISEINTTSISVTEDSKTMAEKVLDSNYATDNMIMSVNATTENSKELTAVTEEIGKIALKNKNNISNLVEKIEEINDSSHKSKVLFNNLLNSTEEISSAVKIINDVCEQTNLIALNASIEAARAGEAGKGFVVVASEIKKLADQSNKSADYINSILHNVNTNTSDSLVAINETELIVQDNLRLLSNTQDDFDKMFTLQSDMINKIMDSRSLITNLEKEINLVKISTNEAYTGSQETSSNMEHITATLEELTASFEDILSYAKMVKTSSDELMELQKH